MRPTTPPMNIISKGGYGHQVDKLEECKGIQRLLMEGPVGYSVGW